MPRLRAALPIAIPFPSGQACRGRVAIPTACKLRTPNSRSGKRWAELVRRSEHPLASAPMSPSSTGVTATQQTVHRWGLFTASRRETAAGPAPQFTVLFTPLMSRTSDLPARSGCQYRTSDSLPGGVFQQTFEGGAIQYTSGSTPIVLVPVSAVRIVGPQNFTTGIHHQSELRRHNSRPGLRPNGAAIHRPTVTWAVTNPYVLSLTRQRDQCDGERYWRRNIERHSDRQRRRQSCSLQSP